MLNVFTRSDLDKMGKSLEKWKEMTICQLEIYWAYLQGRVSMYEEYKEICGSHTKIIF